MLAFLNPFRKVKASEITLRLSKFGSRQEKKAVFSYEFGEKDEKLVNVAAGRIHRKATAGSGEWALMGMVLSVTYGVGIAGAGLDILDRDVSFGEVAELFEEMVK